MISCNINQINFVSFFTFSLFISGDKAGTFPSKSKRSASTSGQFEPVRIHVHHTHGPGISSNTQELLAQAVDQAVDRISTVLSGI
jgi:hypothetical protein